MLLHPNIAGDSSKSLDVVMTPLPLGPLGLCSAAWRCSGPIDQALSMFPVCHRRRYKSVRTGSNRPRHALTCSFDMRSSLWDGGGQGWIRMPVFRLLGCSFNVPMTARGVFRRVWPQLVRHLRCGGGSGRPRYPPHLVLPFSLDISSGC